MRFAAPLLVLLALAVPVDAHHCTTYATARPEVDTGAAYLDLDLCSIDSGCLGSFWVYVESNGIPGLQRQDDIADGTCHDMIEPDTLVL